MKLIPLVSIGVKRNGKTVNPPVGKPFEFTNAEVADLKKLSSETKIDYYREPINEDPTVADDATGKASKKTGKGKGKADSAEGAAVAETTGTDDGAAATEQTDGGNAEL